MKVYDYKSINKPYVVVLGSSYGKLDAKGFGTMAAASRWRLDNQRKFGVDQYLTVETREVKKSKKRNPSMIDQSNKTIKPRLVRQPSGKVHLIVGSVVVDHDVKSVDEAKKLLRSLFGSRFVPEDRIPQKKRVVGRSKARKNPRKPKSKDFRQLGNQFRRERGSSAEAKAYFKQQAQNNGRAAAQAIDEYWKLFESEFKKLHGRKPTSGDWRISGVGDDRLPENVKNELRYLADKIQSLKDSARAYWYAYCRKRADWLGSHYLQSPQVPNPERKKNISQGFVDSTGFHPIRSASDYDPSRLSAPEARPAKRKKAKKVKKVSKISKTRKTRKTRQSAAVAAARKGQKRSSMTRYRSTENPEGLRLVGRAGKGSAVHIVEFQGEPIGKVSITSDGHWKATDLQGRNHGDRYIDHWAAAKQLALGLKLGKKNPRLYSKAAAKHGKKYKFVVSPGPSFATRVTDSFAAAKKIAAAMIKKAPHEWVDIYNEETGEFPFKYRGENAKTNPKTEGKSSKRPIPAAFKAAAARAKAMTLAQRAAWAAKMQAARAAKKGQKARNGTWKPHPVSLAQKKAYWFSGDTYRRMGHKTSVQEAFNNRYLNDKKAEETGSDRNTLYGYFMAGVRGEKKPSK